MKLLFDENLSHRLVTRLEEDFPGSASVHQIGLGSEPDTVIWDYAQENGFIIVSKDGDLRDFSSFRGHPPKVIRLDIGNTGTDFVADLLQKNKDRIAAFLNQDENSLLTLNLEDLDSTQAESSG